MASPTDIPITLLDVTPENYEAVMSLCVAPEQERYVGTVAEAMAHAHFRQRELHTVYHLAEKRHIGFLAYEDRPPMTNGDMPYMLHTFLIDCHYQRRGYGTTALMLFMAALRQLEPKAATRLSVVVSADNDAAIAFYKKLGFVFEQATDTSGNRMGLWYSQAVLNQAAKP